MFISFDQLNKFCVCNERWYYHAVVFMFSKFARKKWGYVYERYTILFSLFFQSNLNKFNYMIFVEFFTSHIFWLIFLFCECYRKSRAFSSNSKQILNRIHFISYIRIESAFEWDICLTKTFTLNLISNQSKYELQSIWIT